MGKNMENPHERHRERMFARYDKTGFAGFAEHEVLEFMLFYVMRQGNTNPTAHRLLDKFGSISNLFYAPPELLKEVSGVGDASVRFFRVISDLFEYIHKKEAIGNGQLLKDEKKLVAYICSQFAGCTYEKSVLLCFDAKGVLIGSEEIAKGTVTATKVDAQMIAKIAFKYNAPQVVIAHNHPGGTATPSKKDFSATHALKNLLAGLDIYLVDHVICERGDGISFLYSGFFDRVYRSLLLQDEEITNNSIKSVASQDDDDFISEIDFADDK